MALITFRFEASFPAHPDYLQTLADLAHALVLYAGCPAAEADQVAAEIRGAIGGSLREAAGGGPVVIECARNGPTLTIEVAAPHQSGLRISKTVPAS